MAHRENCKGCKKVFLRVLEKHFGEVVDQWRSGWPCRLENVLALDVMNKATYRSLNKISTVLEKHRGHNEFVKEKKLRPCDYYVKSLNCLIEIDESQHFTMPRHLTFKFYPQNYKQGFDKKVWRQRCKDMDRHDKRPIYRDEQRAWLDVLRDVLPSLYGMAPTIRIFAKDLAACEERPEKISELIKSSELNKSLNLNVKKENKGHNYFKTIVKNHPEYVGKKLILANGKKDGLFRDNGSCIEIEIKTNGDLKACEFQKTGRRDVLTDSLRKVGRKKLGLKDPSVKQMLKYLVLPEMELERVYNSLRYKYLCSLKDGKYDPEKFIRGEVEESNNLYKALIRAPFRPIKKENLPAKWKNILTENGFPVKKKLDIQKEEQDLDFIVHYLRHNYFDNKDCSLTEKKNLYRELIAIKPGFHEVFMDRIDSEPWHKNELKKSEKNQQKTPVNIRRKIVFKMIHNIYKTEKSFKLDKLNNEICAYRLKTYSPCHVTTGPFVFRKKISISYFDELKEISSGKSLNGIKTKFKILNYYAEDISTRKKFDKFLADARKFCRFL